MGIDLELHLDDHDNLSTETVRNVAFGSGGSDTDGLTFEEENLSAATNSGSLKENPRSNVEKKISYIDDQVHVNITPGVPGEGVGNLEPQIGLEFESKQAAYSFYQEYARSVGFGITIKASRRSKKSGKFIDVKIVCSRFGGKRESDSGTRISSQSCPKTNCKAGMHTKRTQDGKWIIFDFVKDHNHEICLDDFSNALQGGIKQPVNVPCQKKGLQLALDEGDVQLMLDHFKQMQDESPNFFYALDLDDEERLKSVFWVDAKGRHDYRTFYDTVFFDTNYVKNKYKVPFAPIVGVNHHFQFILLGCALIGDETLSTFVWLLQTWIKAMGGQAPNVIITEEDKSLKEAIVQVFPDSRHCFSMWDVFGKIRDKLGPIVNKHEIFPAKFEKCIYRSWTDEQFEKRWGKLVDEFQLREDEYVLSLYEDRKMWVPSCMKGTFLAGFSTSERSESILSFFEEYLSRENTFQEFLEQYRAFLLERNEMEAKAEFETLRRQQSSQSLSSYEQQVSTIYTNEAFNKFQVEVMGVLNCKLQKETEQNTTSIFRVDDIEQRQNFTVSWIEAEMDVHCLCRAFEHKGILCRHALLVLQTRGVSRIPSHYILKRWTKDAKIRDAVPEIPKGLHCRTQRFNELCKRAIRLCEEGAVSQQTYEIAVEALGEILLHSESVNRSATLDPNTQAINSFIGNKENNKSNLLKSSKKRKAYKKRKVCSEAKAIVIDTHDNCQQMGQSSSRGDTLENFYVPHGDMQEMDEGSRPVLNEYFGAQQSMEGVLDLILPPQDGYFNNEQSIHRLGSTHVSHYPAQPSMRGLGRLGFRESNCFDFQDDLEDMDNL